MTSRALDAARYGRGDLVLVHSGQLAGTTGRVRDARQIGVTLYLTIAESATGAALCVREHALALLASEPAEVAA